MATGGNSNSIQHKGRHAESRSRVRDLLKRLSFNRHLDASNMPITLDQVPGWFTKHYPKPSVDPQWLQECFEWVLDAEKPPTLQDAIASVETQLLSSDLQVSMLPGTGIPIHHDQPDTWTLAPGKTPGVLVQITALTEIGQSAWSLNEVRVTREERMRGAPTVNQDTEDDGNVGADDEDEGMDVDGASAGSDAEMDVDDDEEPSSAKKRAKTKSGAVVAKRAPRANRQAAGLRDEEQARRANKLRNFDQRPRNYMAKAGEADRKIQTKMPKHLFAGKRKMGKTDRR